MKRRKKYLILALAVFGLISNETVWAQDYTVYAFIASGPMNFNPCEYFWREHCNIAEQGFLEIGYSPIFEQWPDKESLKANLQNSDNASFFLAAHGASQDQDALRMGCRREIAWETTTAEEIEQWMEDVPKVRFGFIHSCNAFCDTGPGTLAPILTKESLKGTALVGYCKIDYPECKSCSDDSDNWLQDFFSYSIEGETVGQSYDLAMQAYPHCTDCMVFYGDRQMTLTGQAREFDFFGDVYPPETRGDQEISIHDIMTIINYILGSQTPQDWQFYRADVPTGMPEYGCRAYNGQIDILDLMTIINKLLDIPTCADN